MTNERIVVVGDTLLDRDVRGWAERLSPDAPVPVVDELERRSRPGGAGLAACLLALEGRAVTLVTALARDEGGVQLSSLLAAVGVDVIDLGISGSTPEKLRIEAGGHPVVRLDRGGPAGRIGPVDEAVAGAVHGAGAVLVADYGRGIAAEAALREILSKVPARCPIVWDPHPRGPEPVPGVRVATPNAAEAAARVPGVEGDSLHAVTERGRRLLKEWSCAGVAVTLGGRGALLVSGDAPPLVVPAPRVSAGDACGAGDRFSSATVALLADGAVVSEAVEGAVLAASEFVAAGAASSLELDRETTVGGVGSYQDRKILFNPMAGGDAGPREVVARVRDRGGTVVATGGCFDILHAGHVSALHAARALGDCLVVCLNSDSSIRRLKGHDRPVVREEDRAAVLRSLACVDAVLVFDEDTPERVLNDLRPDVFAKGGDYALTEIPEAALVESWGGQAVVVPYLEGRSTTRLIREVARRGIR